MRSLLSLLAWWRHRPPSLDAGIPPQPEVATAGANGRAGSDASPATTPFPSPPPLPDHAEAWLS